MRRIADIMEAIVERSEWTVSSTHSGTSLFSEETDKRLLPRGTAGIAPAELETVQTPLGHPKEELVIKGE